MPKKNIMATVIGQRMLNSTTKMMEIYAPDIARNAQPGQFVNVQVCKNTAPLLRRPLGIAEVNSENGTFNIIYRVIGEGTKILADVCSGDKLSVVGPLGKGFSLEAKRPLLVGGGLGLVPLLSLTEAFCEKEIATSVLIGGRCEEEIFWTELFVDICKKVHVTTDDGSCGSKGTVMALLPELLASGEYDCVYVCGPVAMMKSVAELSMKLNIRCQVSLEKYMACGIGACLSCSCSGIGKRLKVCTDGPVFWAEEVGEW